MKIRNKIFLVFFVVGLALTFMGVMVLYIAAADNLKAEIFNNLKATTEDKEEWVNLYIQKKKDDATMLANSPLVRQLLNGQLISDVQSAEEYLRNFGEFYNYSDLFLIGPDGDVWWSKMQGPELGTNLETGILKDTALAETYKKSKEQREVVYSDYGFYPSYDEPQSFIAAPVYARSNNEFIGIVILQTDIEQINEIIDKGDSLGETGYVYIVGEDLLLRSASQAFEYKSTLKEKIDTLNSETCFNEGEILHESHEGVSQFKNHQNVKVLGTHVYIPEMKWCLLAEMGVDEALAPINEILIVGILLGIFIVFVVFATATWLGRAISRPVLKLKEGIKIVENGNLDLKIGVGTNDEIGDLTGSFNKMTGAMKKSRREVENKVQEQTKEIVKHKTKLENQQKAVLNILEDVADEKDMIAKERDKINTILYSIGDGVFVVDREYRIKVFNKMAARISGFTEEEVYDKKYNSALKFVSEKENKSTDNFIKNAIETGKQQELSRDSVLITKDGVKIPVADSAAPFKDKNGNVIGCIVVFRDITKEREIEKMKSEFVSITSHQLRTPLTVMGWELEMMNKGFFGEFSEKQKVEMEKLTNSHIHMLDLVNDLLDASRIDAGRLELRLENVQLDDIIKNSIDNVSGLAAKKMIKLSAPKFRKSLPFVNVDSLKISEVIQNLIENAVKYTSDGKKVDVRYGVSKDNNFVVFSVKDQGIGIPLKDQKRMFTKFFRADNAIKTKKTGTGLGLYIAKNIVNQLKGDIWFESKEKKGTTFYLKLPIVNRKNT